jgi:chromosome segregation ATPase
MALTHRNAGRIDTMRWIGWAFAVIFTAFFLFLRQRGEGQIRALDAENATRITRLEDDVAKAAKRAADLTAEMTQRLAQEQAKTADLAGRKDTLAADKAKTEAEREEMERRLDALRDKKATVQEQQQEHLAEMTDIQKQIAAQEADILVIRKYLPSVTKQGAAEP